MTDKSAIVLVLCVILFAGHGESLAPAQEDECAQAAQEWGKALAFLEEGMEAYRRIKDESVAPQIQQILDRADHAPTMAAAVRAALEERKLKMIEAREALDPRVEHEKVAYERLTKCHRRSDRRGKRSFSRNALPGAEVKRRLAKDLSDLLLDDAYIQYKDARPLARQSEQYSGYGPTWYWR